MAEKIFTGAMPLQAGNDYVPGLDGLRALSVMLVIIAHLGFDKVVPGGFGVTIFFFVSGFLITRILVGEQNKNDGRIDLKGFYVRRFLRLMPALVVFIIGCTALIAPFGMRPKVEELAAAFLYWMNYFNVAGAVWGFEPIGVPLGHLWSLAVEEHFYLLFPAALAIFGTNHFKRLALVLGVMVASALWRYVLMYHLGGSSDYTYSATETRIESIAWGCLLAILLDGAPRENARLRIFLGWHWIVIGVSAILFTLIYRDDLFRGSWRYTVQGGALFILVLNLYAFKSARFMLDILETAPARWVGRLSYSLYLWHWPMVWIAYHIAGLELGGDAMIPPALMLGVLLASFGAASASYYGVERPMFALRRRFGGKPVENLRNK